MLTRASIQNFRSCADVTMEDIGQVLALIGRNGAGKTNILKALQWVCETASSTGPIHPVDWRLGERPAKVQVDVALGSETYRYSLAVAGTVARSAPGQAATPRVAVHEELAVADAGASPKRLVARTNENVEVLGRQDRVQINAATPSLPALLSLLPPDDQVVVRIARLVGFMTSVRYYPLDEPNEPTESTVITSAAYTRWLAAYRSTNDPGPSIPLRLVHMSLEQKDRMIVLQQLLGRNGLALLDQIRVVPVEPPDAHADKSSSEEPRSYYVVFFYPSQQSGSRLYFDYSQLSSGTRRVLRILVSLLFDDSSVMLLEQPEDSIHAGLMKKLIGLLRQNADAQLILASHSADVLNRLQPNDIRLVMMDHGATQARALTSAERVAATRFINEEGSLAEFVEMLQED